VLHKNMSDGFEEDADGVVDATSLHAGPAYLGSIVVAGGMAGQVQHVMSHYTEQWLRLGEEGGVMVGIVEDAATTATTTSSTRNIFKVRPPILRSVIMAFPASAIGFVAFEYGRNFGTT
jgi:hypothetical protein